MSLNYLRRRATSLLVLTLCGLAAMSSIVVLFAILYYTLQQGARGINLDFFTHLPKPVGEPGGGMANAIVGSGILVGLACLFGLPIGVLAGVYLSEFARRSFYGRFVRFSSDVFSGVSSVAVGVFVYTLMVLPMKHFTALSGGVALSILLVPVVTSATVEMLKMVPSTLREAGLALGIPEWKVTLFVVLRAAAPGIATAALLGVARIAGETAPLLFTAFNNRFWSTHLLEPIASLPVMIFTYAVAPYDDWHRQAWAGALTLITLVFALNLMARLAASRHAGGSH